MEENPKKPQKDKFFNIKYMAYCLSQLPPDDGSVTYSDFIDFAKFQLCYNKKVLLKDPIWDNYTDEELLLEYFALIMESNEKFRKDFEVQIRGGTSLYDDDISWMDEQIAMNNEENSEEEFDFKPEDIKR